MADRRNQSQLKAVFYRSFLFLFQGITGYRDDSLETVKRNRDQYGIPLKILSYEELYGWTMDKIVSQVREK